MPRGDGTGPMGMGSMTGRGAGFCSGNVSSVGNYAGYGCGRGYRRNFVAGMPVARMPVAGVTYAPVVNEKEVLSRQVDILENQLAEVKKRISSIDNSAER